jgi:RimJ/RimL family protein N-acetyltransferase
MLEGKSVRLRPVEVSDLDPNYRWMNDTEVTRHIAIRYPISRAHEEQWLAARPANDFSNGVTYAIETKEGVYIGNLGLHDPHPEHRSATLGIVIGEKDYWSNGYGTDAIVALLRFGFDQMNLHRVSLHVFEFNQRAVACYKKCGFQMEGTLRHNYYGEGAYHDVIVMGVLRDEFEALHGVSPVPEVAR